MICLMLLIGILINYVIYIILWQHVLVYNLFLSVASFSNDYFMLRILRIFDRNLTYDKKRLLSLLRTIRMSKF